MANAYEITELDSLEHDTGNGIYNTAVRIDDTHFIGAYAGTDSDGYVKTFSVNGAYEITEVDSLEFADANTVAYLEMVQIDATHFILAWRDSGSDLHVTVFAIDGGFNITQTSTLEVNTTFNGYFGILMLDSTHFVVARRDTDNAGAVTTFVLDGGYNVTQIDELIHDSSIAGGENSLYKLDDTHFVLAYEDNSLRCTLKTFSVDSSYDNITEIHSITNFVNVTADSASMSQISSNRFLLFQGGTSTASLHIIDISGSYQITETSELNLGHAGWLNSVLNIDSSHFIIAYAGANADGYVSVIGIDNDVLSVINSTEHDVDNGTYNSLVWLDDDHFALMYAGLDSDGFIKTFAIDIPLSISKTESITLLDSASTFKIGGGIHVFVGGLASSNEYTDSILPTTLNVRSVLTRQIDSANFTIKKYGTVHAFTPLVGQEVFVYVEGVREFAGIITRVTQSAQDFKILLYDVVCEDYARLLDRKLIADTYQNQTLESILNSLKARYFNDFTLLQVDNGTTEIAYAGFNYETASQALTKLCDKLNYDWYVDYYKNIYFISKTSLTAPFDISDANDTYIFDTFRLRTDNTQVRNRVFVAGGQYLADTFTTEYVSDGIQNVYPLAYQYDEIAVSVTGQVWDGGIDGSDPQSTKDYLWNSIEKFIRFRGDRIPNDTSSVRIAGQPYLPVRVSVQDDTSINALKALEGGDGIYEHIIVDDTINSQEGARERANAELEAYKNSLAEGSFTTKRQGLRSGQRITINSTVHGVNDSYLINSVRMSMRNNIEPRWEVSVVSVKTIGVIEVLQNLLQAGKAFTLGENEVVDNIRGFTETVDLAETFTAQIDYDVEFVAGEYDTPTGTKRVFVLDRSPLGSDMHPYQVQDVGISESVTVSIS